MATTKHEFLLDLFITEGFNVITREGLQVTIGAIDTLADNGHQIIGWVTDNKGNKTSYAWDLQGKMYGWSNGLFSHDLFLEMK